MYTKLATILFIAACYGCSSLQDVPIASQIDNAESSSDASDKLPGETIDNTESSSDAFDKLSEETKEKMIYQFRQEINRLQKARETQPEYRVLIVNWTDPNNKSLELFTIVRGLTDGGEIWLNSHAADVIDADWRQFGNANYEGTFKTLPALINWISTHGWRLIEVHDSHIGHVLFPQKLYFIKKIDNPSSANHEEQDGQQTEAVRLQSSEMRRRDVDGEIRK